MEVRKWQRWLKPVLIPLSWVYGSGVKFRNSLYRTGIKRPVKFEVPIISVGNLSVGGTGKTPFTAYLISELRGQYNLAIVSRGYGRKTKGVVVAEDDSTPEGIGDEPAMLYRQFSAEIPVVVAEQRVLGISEVFYRYSGVNLILLDDGFQHLAVKRDVNLLLTTSEPFFTKDRVFPAGLLREPRSSAKRATAVIVTKGSEEEITKSSKQLGNYTQAPLFQAKQIIHAPFPAIKDDRVNQAIPQKFYLFSGIARPEFFEKEAAKMVSVLGAKRFPDHINYTEDSIKQLIAKVEKTPGAALLCTEKDAIKLQENKAILPWLYYLPMELEIHPEQQEIFWNLVHQKLKH
jgi:tetraacyldisaccharide 4'-kinase